ncbi:MAG: sarcosine oxidase subunit gamma family protein [Xanthomonadales bacterium]|nr:sarcosine oxidase subunit gamma family protein [Xanthomonadales bacterium]
MSETLSRRHGLESFVATTGQASGQAALKIEIMTSLTHINLRGDPADPEFADAVQAVLGQKLPTAPNTVTTGAHRALWLGPDEWLILTNEPAGDLAGQLAAALNGQYAAVNEVSGGQILLRLRGPLVRELLSAGCTLDFHPRAFRTDSCAQSGLAKANVLICAVDELPTFDIVVRRSFAEYLLRWIRSLAGEQGSSIAVS